MMCVIPAHLNCSRGPDSVTFCCKWLTLPFYFQYCKTLIISVHLVPTHHRTELQTTQLSRYLTWIVEMGEGKKGEQSCLS